MNEKRRITNGVTYSIPTGKSQREKRRREQEAIEAGIRAKREKPRVNSRFTGNVSNGKSDLTEVRMQKEWEKELETYIFTAYKKDQKAFCKALKFRVKKILNQCQEFRYAVYFPKEIFPETARESEKTRNERKSAKNEIVIFTIIKGKHDIIEKWKLTLPEDWYNKKMSFPNILQLTGEVTQEDFDEEEIVELQFINFPE